MTKILNFKSREAWLKEREKEKEENSKFILNMCKMICLNLNKYNIKDYSVEFTKKSETYLTTEECEDKIKEYTEKLGKIRNGESFIKTKGSVCIKKITKSNNSLERDDDILGI